MSYYDTRVLADTPAHYLAIDPDESGATFEDATANDRDGTAVGGYSRGAASLLAGFPGAGAVNFDGTGRITTGYGTRRNRFRNPSIETNAEYMRGLAVSNCTETADERSATWSEDGAYAHRWAGTHSADSNSASAVLDLFDHATSFIPANGQAVTGGQDLTVGATYNITDAPSTGTLQCDVLWYTAAAAFISASQVATIGTTVGDRFVTGTVTAPPTAAFAIVRAWNLFSWTTNADTFEIFTDGIIVCDGSVALTAADYHPTVAQLASGEAGWLGTAHASASDIGAIPNGAPRSWEGWHKRADQLAAHTLFGSDATSNATRLVCASGSDDVLWIVNGTTYTFTGGWFGTDACYWAFAFDEANDTAELWVYNADTGESFHEEKTGVSAQHAAGQTLQWGAHGSGTDGADGDAAKLASYELLLSAAAVEGHYKVGAVPSASVSVPPTAEDYFRSHRFATRIDVLVNGEVERTIPITDGAVRLDSRAASQRSLDLTVPDDGSGDIIPTDPASLLAPYGNELQVHRGLYIAGEATLVSLGIFRIDRAPTDGETVRVSARDRSAIVIDATFEDPYTVTSGAQLTDTITEVITEGYPGLVVGTNFIDVDIALPALIADEGEDRWAFAEGLATAAGCALYFDDAGELALAPVPSNVSGNPIATFEEGDGVSLQSTANLLSAERDWDREPVFNRVPVAGENTTEDAVVSGVALDDNELSATYYYGPFGRKSMPTWTNPYLTTDDQCANAAAAILAEKVGIPDSLTFEALVDPERRPWDVVRVNRERLGVAEDHVLDALSIPLTPEGSMSASTRATQELSSG